MTPRGGKAKGRRLQVRVAVALARAFELTIEATPPTPTGRRDGVDWVAETAMPDLMVRRMGEAGADVALLTDKARASVSLGGKPLWIECKNHEAGLSFALDSAFWLGKRKPPALLQEAYRQAAVSAMGHGHVPLGVVSRNHFPALVITDVDWGPGDRPTLVYGCGVVVMELEDFVERLKRAQQKGA